MIKLAISILMVTSSLAAQAPASSAKPAQGRSSPPALPDAKTILAKAAQAAGGSYAQQSVKTEKLTGKMLIPAMGVSGTIIRYRTQKGEMYQVMEIPGAGKVEVGNDGDVEWERSTLTGPKIRRVAATPGNLLQLDPASLATRENFARAETAGLDSANGKPCFALHIWPVATGPMQTICYDQETYLPLKLDLGTAASPIKMSLGDYRTVGSVKMPFLIETEAMGQTIRLEIETITVNEPLPREAMQLPEEIEKLAYRHEPNEIKGIEVDKDRPTLRRKAGGKAK